MTTKQFSINVVNFSSQYGRHSTSSYTASNLAGKPHIGNKYGDFVEAFVLRKYGKWWKTCPSANQTLSKVAPNFISEDFVELEFQDAVIPKSIIIYETYHPGSVVRILACNTTSKDSAPGQVKWVTLWSGAPQCSQIPQAVRKFSPPLKEISFPTRHIRLEFNSEECQYYTELDAVELIGKVPDSTSMQMDRALGFQVDITTRLLRNISLFDRQISTSSQDGDDDFDKWSFWAMLPDEVIQNIFSYLDIVSLCNVAQTCTLLLKNAYDPLLLSDLDLQSRWNTVDNVALESLVTRCASLKRLNLSWTGGGGLLTEDVFCRFLEECGKELTKLCLSCCQYIFYKSLKTIATVCTQLEELDLQSCNQLDDHALMLIGEMKNLRRLNLYGIRLKQDVVNAIGNCIKLEHLNLGGCHVDESTTMGRAGIRFATGMTASVAVLETIKKLKNLVSLDLWRIRRTDQLLIKIIAENCPNLEELDIGWCPVISSSNFPCELLCLKCPKLKKLFLTAGRNVTDADLYSIAKYCKGMEQLDILGTKVSESGIDQVCKECPNLTFFDISFCGSISEGTLAELKSKYSRVCFKKSFQ